MVTWAIIWFCIGFVVNVIMFRYWLQRPSFAHHMNMVMRHLAYASAMLDWYIANQTTDDIPEDVREARWLVKRLELVFKESGTDGKAQES